MSQNRITVKIEPELQPTRLEDRMDVNAEIKVDVDTRFTKLAIFGIAAMAVGFIAIFLGSILFALNYPDPWYASMADADKWLRSRNAIKAVGVSLAIGIIALLLGASAFFHGRTVLGAGRLDQFATKELEVSH